MDYVGLLMEHDVRHSFIRCCGNVFHQQWGTPQGSPLADSISNSFATQVEAEKPNTCPHTLVKRYKDDKIAIVFRRPEECPVGSFFNMQEGKPAVMAQDFYPYCELEPNKSEDTTFCGFTLKTRKETDSGVWLLRGERAAHKDIVHCDSWGNDVNGMITSQFALDRGYNTEDVLRIKSAIHTAHILTKRCGYPKGNVKKIFKRVFETDLPEELLGMMD